MNVLRRHAYWIAAMTLGIVSGCGAPDETATSGSGPSSSGEGASGGAGGMGVPPAPAG